MVEPLAGLIAAGGLVLAVAACDGRSERAPDAMSRGGGGEPLPARSAVADARVAGEWRSVGADAAGSRYSPLTEINARNVADLAPVWTVALARPAPGTDAAVALQSTPLVAGGVMYLTSGSRVIALDAATGREVWRYGSGRIEFAARGMTYWPGDDTAEPRLYVAAADRLLALNARTGRAVAGFGNGGQIVATIADGTAPLIIGARVFVAAAASVRAYALHDGEALWRFDVPHPQAQQLRIGGITAEQDRGIIHVSVNAQPSAEPVPQAMPMPPSSVIALDAPQGRLLWQYDVVRADVWGHGIVSGPLLYEAGRGASRVPGLALLSGAGLIHLLQRASGEPLTAVTERPTPGASPDALSPITQPVQQTAALHRSLHQRRDVLVAAEATDATHAAACAALLRDASQVTGVDPFSPIAAAAGGDTPAAFVRLPAARFATAGAMALDPALGYLFMNVSHVGEITYVAADTSPGRDSPDRSSRPFVAQPDPPTAQGAWPCQPPPWGELVAVNTADGAIAWRVPLGATDGLPSDRRDTGRPGRGGPLATAGGLVFIGSTDDRKLRAFSSGTGEELWRAALPMNAYSMPFTYTAGDGRQYVAVIASGEPILDSRVWMPVVTPQLLTFALRGQ